MARFPISLGTLPNDGTGSPLRTAGEYINSNFIELYNKTLSLFGFLGFVSSSDSPTDEELTGYWYLASDNTPAVYTNFGIAEEISKFSRILKTDEGWEVSDDIETMFVPFIGARSNVDLGDYTIDIKRILQSNNGGSIFIGENAGLSDDLTFNANIAIGQYALMYIGGSYNIAIGTNSLRGDSENIGTGTHNIAIGNNNLDEISTGSNNTAIGSSVLAALKTGSYNTAIGKSAGYTSISSESCVFIGENSRGYANNTINEIVIGSKAIGNGSNTATIGDDNITDFYAGEDGQADIHGNDIISSGVIVSTGTTGTTPVSGAGTRLMWIPEKGAFRVGVVEDDEWDDTNIGDVSVALNFGTKASGANSTAINTVTTASGESSLATGTGGVSIGDHSATFNYYTRAESYATTAIGRYNVGGGTANSWVATDPIFEIGIGESSVAKANAMTVLKNGTTLFGDVAGGNYLEIDANGQIRLYGLATQYDDLRVSAVSTKLGGSKDPGFEVVRTNGSGSQGVFTYMFDSSTEEELYFAVQLPHTWKQGSNIEAHVHWLPMVNGAAGTDVSWGLEYSWANIGDVLPTTTIIYGDTNHLAETLVQYKHYITELGAIDATDKTFSSMLLCRVFRDATGGGGTDDYTGDAALLEIDFHYQIDSLGSNEEYVKY